MVRKMKINIHIYFPEASHRGNNVDICECFYLKHAYQRKLKRAQLRYYAEAHEKKFEKAIKDKEKRKNNAENDQFFIVLDTDIHANKANVHEVKRQFSELAKTYKDKVKIIVSSRSFEVWLCMFDRAIYTKPFESQNQLNKEVFGNYVKKEEWYKENSEKLYSQFQSAKEASVRSKKTCISNYRLCTTY